MTDLPPPSGPSLFERLIHARRPLVLLILMGALCWWVGSSAADNYRWQWYRVWRYIGTVEDGVFTPGPLLEGLAVTLELAASSLVLAVVAGGSVAFLALVGLARGAAHGGRFSRRGAQHAAAHAIVCSLLRGGPGVRTGAFRFRPRWPWACLRAVIWRKYSGPAWPGLPRTQWEAAFSLGMSTATACRYVILPQALRHVLPPLAGQAVSLIKDTSLVSAIAVADITMRGRVIITDTFLSFEIWLLVAAAYLFLTLLVSIPARLLERHSLLTVRGAS